MRYILFAVCVAHISINATDSAQYREHVCEDKSNQEHRTVEDAQKTIARPDNTSILKLNGNKITQISGLEPFSQLMRLELRNNGIPKIQGLDSLQNLVLLDLDGNKIQHLENIEKLQNLIMLKLQNNSIKELPKTWEIDNPQLHLCLNGNPICDQQLAAPESEDDSSSEDERITWDYIPPSEHDTH